MVQVTPWFGCSTVPVRPGIYERQHKKLGFKVYARWDGKKWLLGHPSIAVAEETWIVSQHQGGYMWRGVLK